MQDLTGKTVGSSLSSGEWNQLPQEVQNVITALGLVLSSGDTDQLGQALAGYVGSADFYADAGAADAYVCQVVGSKQGPAAVDADSDGLLVRFRPTNANTGASTLNVNATGVLSILRESGSALSANDLVTTRDAVVRYNHSDTSYRLLDFAVAQAIDVPRGFIDGLILENNSGTPDSHLDFGVGVARDDTDAVTISLGTGLTKRIDLGGGWVAGTNLSGLPTPLTLTADTWYHCFVIRDGSGNVDCGFDTSVTAVNLLADSGYTTARRVGAVLTDATSDILLFNQWGDHFYWTGSGFLDHDADPPNTAVTVTLTHVPLGVEVLAKVSTAWHTEDSVGASYATWATGQDPAPAASSVKFDGRGDGDVDSDPSVSASILTNTSQEIQGIVSNASTDRFTVLTKGWQDPRGKDA